MNARRLAVKMTGQGTFRLYYFSESDGLGAMDKLPYGYISPFQALDESYFQALEQLMEKLDPVYAYLEPGDLFTTGAAGLAITWNALAVAAIPALCTALGAWLGSRNGRKVLIKVGDIEADAQTREDVEKLLARAREIQQEIQQRNQPPKIIP